MFFGLFIITNSNITKVKYKTKPIRPNKTLNITKYKVSPTDQPKISSREETDDEAAEYHMCDEGKNSNASFIFSRRLGVILQKTDIQRPNDHFDIAIFFCHISNKLKTIS